VKYEREIEEKYKRGEIYKGKEVKERDERARKR